MIEDSNEDKFVTYEIDFNHRSLGQRLQQKYNNELRDSISQMSKSQIKEFIKNGEIVVNDITVYKDDLYLHKKFKPEVMNEDSITGITDDEYAVLIDYSADAEIERMHMLREFITRVQKFRKQLELNIDDQIEIFYNASTENLGEILDAERATVEAALLKPFAKLDKLDQSSGKLQECEFLVGDEKATIYIKL